VSPAGTTPTLHERTRWVYEHLPEGVDRLLDAGCHDGATTRALAPRARLAVGIDLDTMALLRGARSRDGVQLLSANGSALPFRDGVFDCVVFSEVLEHVPAEAEEACVAELRRVTRDGGTLILTTPHRGTFWWLDPLMFKTHLRRAKAGLLGRRGRLKGHKHYRVDEVRRLLEPHFDVRLIERPGRVLYPLAYWGHLLPFGLGRRPMLVRLWQYLMDRDYSRDHGDAAYNVCIVARAR
jgi:SAM-dependent methyltransferase